MRERQATHQRPAIAHPTEKPRPTTRPPGCPTTEPSGRPRRSPRVRPAVSVSSSDSRANLWLAGVDLDTCRDPATGQVAPWAQTVLDRLDTYAEVSPSGLGVKAYLLIDRADIAPLRAIMGTQHGRQFKQANGAAHPPAIELYISHRYFAVTWQAMDGRPDELRVVPLDDLRWLIEEYRPDSRG